MDIRRDEIRQFKALISKEDRQLIARKLGNSERTVEAVICGNRDTIEIQKMIVDTAKEKVKDLLNTIEQIETRNIDDFTFEDYQKYRKSTLWSEGDSYGYYIDLYLELSHIKFNDSKELIDYLDIHYRKIFTMPFYLIDIVRRIIGCTEYDAFNSIIKHYRNIN